MTSASRVGTLPFAVPSAVRRPHDVLFVETRLWPGMIFGSLLIAAALLPWYIGDSLWVGAGLALAALVVWQGMRATAQVPWVPGLILFVACLQWVIAPWVAYHVPPPFALYEMIFPAPDYFGFAVPATLAFAVGMAIAVGTAHASRTSAVTLGPAARLRLERTCDAMVVGGVFVRFFVLPRTPGSLNYFMLLVADLSYVGAFALLLLRARGWIWRVAFVLGVQVVVSSEDGMFHQLLLWSAYCGGLFAYRYRVRPAALLAGGVGMLVVIFAINGLKMQYREAIHDRDLPVTARATLFAETFYDQVTNPTKTFSPKNISYSVTRLNQGWIIEHEMAWVPDAEPYARGETVEKAVEAALLPRILAPNKVQVGGAYFERFTGLSLGSGTSMNLGLLGEMYANFGRTGGIAAMLVMGLGIGLLFRAFVRLSRRSPLWWAWVPFVMLNATKAESDLTEALNHVTKSSVVMFAFVSIVPAWLILARWMPRARARQR